MSTNFVMLHFVVFPLLVLCAFVAGKLHERYRWGLLIAYGVINKPQKTERFPYRNHGN